ncbi:nucleotidyl transferase AbiEii/AbiGii toxin family protein [Stigmatella sp. ncwal1]|uniref:Nucleotidyl transferase AbiEii/AbiGii toxin family protein n=1 Tax=Stigmatella ashevillensis TaxID=2995309 RepID=A0ABT5DD60_9BACT|nr:nucleotidyl transferase AbiEii/AbiGii toxin family protein [Stigmatella ashevillena]MDC0711544.1 nucleotidyl transferase AbiEii/AbiGii toxin family protein [Stigmatella ashevillena]
MKTTYPSAFQEISAWAASNSLPVTEARGRFAQYAVLRAIAGSRTLSSTLVFKGGNALDFVWQPNRSTKDLDFSSTDSSLNEEQLRKHLTQGLEQVQRVLGVAFRVQKVERQPPGAEKTFVTYAVTIGYALPDEPRNQERIAKGQPCPNIVPLDISLNEPICDTRDIDVQGVNLLRVSTVEDIVAEKLRALLQQPIRNRNRRQDLLDIAVLLRADVGLDVTRVAEYLKRKAEAREVRVSRAAFNSVEVKERARVDYEALKSSTRASFIPFEEAFQQLQAFVGKLDIPN